MPPRLFGPKSCWLILLLWVGLALSGCTVPNALIVKTPTPAPTNAVPVTPAPESSPVASPVLPAPRNAHLQAALALSPAMTDYFAFTDWTVIKEVAGVPELTSEESMDARVDFIRPLGNQSQAVGSFFANSHFLRHAESWGWDNTDLLWEATLTVDGPPLYLLRFRDDFDFAPVFALLNERGYTVAEYARAPFYHHEMDFSLDWQRTSEFAVLNIAFLEDERLFILASAPEVVTATLDAIAQGATLASLPGVQSVAAELGDAGAAILSPLGCQQFDVASLLLGSSERIQAYLETLREAGISGLYTVFGLGYRPPLVEAENDALSDATVQEASAQGPTLPLGIFVHHYPLADQAHADLAPRRTLAQSGTSLANNAPYAELFEVVDATVTERGDGSANLVLALHARERAPQLFFNMFQRRDLLFSACGGF